LFPNFYYDLQVSAVGSGVCIPNVGNRREDKKEKQNFDPGKQIILPSSNTLELGCQIVMPTKEATIKSKARKQHLLQNKQTSKEEGKPEH
jgi:hypothetical protein